MELSSLEKKNVLESYQEISNCFDNTRAYIWPSVKEFLDYIPPRSKILDAGCGNGKNMILNEDLLKEKQLIFNAFDISDNLLSIAEKKVKDDYKKVRYNNETKFYKANIINIPEENGSFDFVISIAVIHHLDTFDKRVKAILECLRVLKDGGKFMFQIWSFEQDNTKLKFERGDNMVPWKIRKKDIDKDAKGEEKNDIIRTVNRYYYISDYQDICLLVNKCLSYNTSKLVKMYNEMGNWIIILEKKEEEKEEEEEEE